MDCIYKALFYFTGQSALQRLIHIHTSHTHTHTPMVARAAKAVICATWVLFT